MKPGVSVDELGEEEEVGVGEDLLDVQPVVPVPVRNAHQIDCLVPCPVRILWIQKLNYLTPSLD